MSGPIYYVLDNGFDFWNQFAEHIGDFAGGVPTRRRSVFHRNHDKCFDLVVRIIGRSGVNGCCDLRAIYHFGCATDKLNRFSRFKDAGVEIRVITESGV